MVWSQLDFEREVRRQLIELRSLRKCVSANVEVLQRIERLEASHHGLLRRLGELFLNTTGTAYPPGVRHSTATDRLDVGEVAASSSSQTARFAVLEEPEELDGQELCPRCGRLLLPSLLSGERVIQFDRSWLHASCLENQAGGGERHYGPL